MNRIILSIVLFLFLVSCKSGDTGNTPQKQYTYPVPGQAALGSDTGLIQDHFYMIGWSEDGKLAYVNEPGDEACGCYFIDLYIVDAAQNKTVYHYHFTDEDQSEGVRAGDNLATVWKRQERMFTDSLNHYGIVPGNYILTADAATQTGKGALRASVEKTVAFNKDRNQNMVTAYRVLLHRHVSILPLYSSTAEEEKQMLLDVYPAAVVTEPSNNYAAVVLAQKFYGWEGPPNTLRYEVYSCRFK